ncbi:MAG: hypothetical protein LUH05_08880 [Candidatus Gastranaerophilales bacterium]|nr:hypothetical protein [Candidatus Gastranaerophilales bacterium]
MKETLINDTYKKKYFGGVLSIKFNVLSNDVIYRFLGIKFMHKSFYDGGKSFYKLFNFIKFKRSARHSKDFLLPVLALRIKQKTGMENIDIIPLLYHLGETFLLLCNMKEWMENNDIKNPVFVSGFANLKSLCEIFYPEIPFILVSPMVFNLHFVNINNFSYKGVRYFENLSRSCFEKYEEKIKNDTAPGFYQQHKQTLGISGINITEPLYPDEIKNSAETKMKMLGLKKPFAFISPNSKSNGTMTKEFWDKLPVELYNLGYDMFFNAIPWNVPNSSYKHCFLTVAEAMYIARQADLIFGVRSGLMDVITNPNSKIFCVYHAFFKRGNFAPICAQKIWRAFTLKQLPFVNTENIFEYNGEEEAEEKILQDIIAKLSNKKQEVLFC